MPVILAAQDYARWLSGDDPRELLRACPDEMLVAYPVSSRVNRPQENDADLVQASDTVKRVDHDC
jgi:putative SOS response-associated peptidase YedK